YDWDLPMDCGPLEQNIRRIAAGEVDVVLFTSGNQLFNVLKLADGLGIAEEVRAGFRNAVVASIGPTTSEMLRNEDLPVDFEPSHPKMGHLVTELSERAAELLSRKRGIQTKTRNPQSTIRNFPTELHNSPFLRACRREPTDYTP